MTLWTILLTFLSPASAAEVLFPAPDIPALEYRAYLQAHSELATPSGALDDRRPARAARERLIRLFTDAQAAYLSGDRESARKSFEAVISEGTSDDWREPDREILVTSHLRLAQLAATPEERHAYLRNSAVWGEVEINRGLFPPPLIAEREENLKGLPIRELHFAGLGRDWSRILVNGQVCTLNPCRLKADSSTAVRVTWLSDRWLPVSKVTLLEQVERIQPDRRAWLGGRCDSPKWSEESGVLGRRVAFFGLECAPAGETRTAERPPVTTAASGPAWPKSPPEKERPFYKSPWRWIGVGTLAAIVVASSHKPKDKEPTTTYGY